jgi:hypothetical protein
MKMAARATSQLNLGTFYSKDVFGTPYSQILAENN